EAAIEGQGELLVERRVRTGRLADAQPEKGARPETRWQPAERAGLRALLPPAGQLQVVMAGGAIEAGEIETRALPGRLGRVGSQKFHGFAEDGDTSLHGETCLFE